MLHKSLQKRKLRLEVAFACKYIPQVTFETLDEKCEHIFAM